MFALQYANLSHFRTELLIFSYRQLLACVLTFWKCNLQKINSAAKISF